MERLTKKQKEILEYLKAFLNGKQYSEVIKIFKSFDERTEIKILVENGLIKLNDSNGEPYNLRSTRYPLSILLTITPKGIEKLRETFTTQLKDTAWKNPWAVVTIIVSLILAPATFYYYYENLNLQKQNFDLQNQIRVENELKLIEPPTIWLTQRVITNLFDKLQVVPTLYIKKNSERLFTITHFEPNVTLDGGGMDVRVMGMGYDTRFRGVGIREGEETLPLFELLISDNDLKDGSKNLVINYVLEIKDMDSQIRYRGNVTTEINSSSFPSGNEPLIFNWTKI